MYAIHVAVLVASLAPVAGARTSESGAATQPPAPAGEGSDPASPFSLEDPSDIAPGTLRGRVLAYGSRDRLAAVRVIQIDGDREAETDEYGYFELQLPPGEHRLLVRADGYMDLRTTVRISTREAVVLQWRLRPDLDRERFRTLVESEREVGVSRTTLRDEEIHDVAGTRGDPFRVVKSLPGVSQVAGFLPYVVVRGAAPGNTGYYLDGVRVPLLFHVAVGPSVVHPYFIDEVHFYPGGAPVRLGRFTSGIIEGRTKPARRDRPSGEVDLRITDSGALLEIPINRKTLPGCTEKRRRDCPKTKARGALTFAGRFSYTGWLLSQIESLNVKLQFWDYQARFDHDLGRRLRYTAFAYGSFDSIGPRVQYIAPEPSFDPAEEEEVEPGSDEVDPPGPTEAQVDENPDPFLQFEFHRFDHRLRQRMQNGGQALYMLAFGFDRSGASTTTVNEWLIAPRFDLSFPLNGRAELGFGLDQEVKVFKVDAELEDLNPSDVEDLSLFLSSRVVSATGIYADLRWSKGLVELRPGVRLDAYVQVGASPYLPQADSITNAIGVDPRLLAREKLNSRWTLRQAIGVYHQPPDLPVPLPALESFGFDRGLQRSIQGSQGYEFTFGRGVMLSQDVYLGRLHNLQDVDVAQNSDDPVDELEDLITNVSGWAFGVESMLKLPPTLRLYGWAAYTLSRAIRVYPVGGTARSSWDQTHLLNIVLGYKVAHKYRLGGRVHFNTGRPYTAVMSGQTDVEALAKNRNNRSLPPFFQFDIRAERILVFPDWELHLTLDVTNSTLSREYLACTTAEAGQDEPFGSLVGCPSPLAFRYIVPSVGMRGVF